MEIKPVKADLGVIVARFQTPYLTAAHCELIEFVRDRHKKMLIILGIAPVCPSTKNPLDYPTRLRMIQEKYPNIPVLGMNDNRSDAIWSKNVDKMVRNYFPHETVALYGARDSFIKHYVGNFTTVELESNLSISGTEARKNAFHEVRETEDFRAGVCYAAANQYKKNVLCVDVAIMTKKPTEFEVLIARKKEDGEFWRFVGGHVDVKDSNAESAARREAQEETGAAVDGIEYIGTSNIDDWRYTGIDDRIFTIFYAAFYQFGRVEGADDIDGGVKWFPLSKLNAEMFVPEHRVLFEMLKGKYANDRKLCGSVSAAI